MRILIVHQFVSPDTRRADERDVLVQAEHVRSALATLGHETETLAVKVGLSALRERLKSNPPDVVFNLVESLARSDARIVDVPMLLDSLRIPYTGAPASALMATNNKVRAKERMRMVNLPTPRWATRERGQLEPPYIVKADEEHASLGLSQRSIVRASELTPQEEIAARLGDSFGTVTLFAEQFIDGREINVSLLADPAAHDVQVLPIAEIDFSKFQRNRERIVDYKAKWDERSFAYKNTPRVFIDEAREGALAEQLRTLAKKCWKVFGVRGYARVDFRIDAAGEPWILEINCNPCLSPDAGFAAALANAGIGWDAAVARILQSAVGK